MFEQDYVMRHIKKMVQAFLKLLFNIQTYEINLPIIELMENTEEKELSAGLLNMADNGNINEAEKRLYDMLGSNGSLKTALLFYSYLNDKNDDFLTADNFSREEIISGINQVMDRYELGSLTRVILLDS